MSLLAKCPDKEFKWALEPGNIDIQYETILYFREMGRFEEANARQMHLDESAPRELPWLTRLAVNYMWAGRYDEALEEAKKRAQTHPCSTNDQILAKAYAYKGMSDEASFLIDKIMASPDAQNDSYILLWLANVQAILGRREEAMKTIEKIKAISALNNADYPFDLARIHAVLGDKDRAFELLDRAHEQHYQWMLSVKYDPDFGNLRGDPRFKDLLKKIGFDGR